MGNTSDPMVGSIFNVCICFYMHWSDIWVTQLSPREGRYSTFVLFLRALERHMGNTTDHMGGLIFNMCIVVYTHRSDIWVTKPNPCEGRHSTFVLFFACIGTAHG